MSVRTVTVKGTPKTRRVSLDLAQEPNMAMYKTALDALSLIRGRGTVMGSLSLAMDTQTLVVEGDKDLVMDTL